jgi:hypothetical protein
MKLKTIFLMAFAVTTLALTGCDSLTGDGDSATPKGGCGSHGTTTTTGTTSTVSAT